ncbi:MAG: hypothetical protein KAW12_24340 [Candidatus Aminicenantes bacterium]|nr:hypothetical protein [Candidatus Aminicenantes bacterium]
MKKKNIFAVALLLAAAVMWCFVSCGSGEKNTETILEIAASETSKCNLTVFLRTAPSFKNSAVITAVDLNGSGGGNPSLHKGEKIPANGTFVGVRNSKPVTIKVKTDDDAVATLTIPCDTSKAAVDYPSEIYSVQKVLMPYNGIQFRFQPKAVQPGPGDTAGAETGPCKLEVFLSAEVTYVYEVPLITAVETDGSILAGSSLKVGAKLPYTFGDKYPIPLIGFFDRVQAGKPVTIKVKTYDGSVATLTIPCDTSKAAVDFRSDRYKVDSKVMDNQRIRFNFFTYRKSPAT